MIYRILSCHLHSFISQTLLLPSRTWHKVFCLTSLVCAHGAGLMAAGFPTVPPLKG